MRRPGLLLLSLVLCCDSSNSPTPQPTACADDSTWTWGHGEWAETGTGQGGNRAWRCARTRGNAPGGQTGNQACPVSCGTCPSTNALTLLPTNAPTKPFPDLTELDPTCNVYVSNTAGADSDSCGQTSSSACGSIQKGIDLAGAYNTVCVQSGI